MILAYYLQILTGDTTFDAVPSAESIDALSASSIPGGVADRDPHGGHPSPAGVRDDDREVLDDVDVNNLLVPPAAVVRELVSSLDNPRTGSLVADVLIRLIDDDAVARGIPDEAVDDAPDDPDIEARAERFAAVSAGEVVALLLPPVTPVDDLGEGPLGSPEEEEADGGTGGGGGLLAPPLSSRSFCSTALRLAYQDIGPSKQ